MRLLLSKNQIRDSVKKIAYEISNYFSFQDEIHFITILKEGIHFSVDLAKYLENYNLVFDYIFLENINPQSRELAIQKDIFLPVKNKKVIVCTVLTRTGYEISFIENYLKIREAREVKTVSLICKDGAHKKPDFFSVIVNSDYYLVGYGLDYHEKYRNLEEVYII